jgi:hypothetical protein
MWNFLFQHSKLLNQVPLPCNSFPKEDKWLWSKRLFIHACSSSGGQTCPKLEVATKFCLGLGRLKTYVLKLAYAHKHVQMSHRFRYFSGTPPPKLTTLQNNQSIHFKHQIPDVAFLLAPKMMGHVPPPRYFKTSNMLEKWNPIPNYQCNK